MRCNREEDLYGSLKGRNERMFRPVLHAADNVTVKFGVALVKILDYDTDNGILKLNTWLRFVWNDAYLKWDPADWDGIEYLRFWTSY